MHKEKTLILIKPDSIKKNIIGEIITHFENMKLKVVALKMTKKDKLFFNNFYIEHLNKPFFNELMNFMTSSHIVALVLEGNNVINKSREIIGHTDYKIATKNTIRHKFASSLTENAVHGSDSIKSAIREINLFFDKNELY